MKHVLLKPAVMAVDLLHTCQARMLATAEAASPTPRQRRIMLASAALTCAGLCIASAAHAEESDGIAGMATKAAAQGDSAKSSIGKLFAAAGFAGAGIGGYHWWKKGKEGEQSRITGGQIFFPILAGAVLGAIGFVMIKAGESVGIAGSSRGQLPQETFGERGAALAAPTPMIPASDRHDPARVDTQAVQPRPGLGASFEVAAYPALTLSASARIWGQPDAEDIELDPAGAPQHDLHRRILLREGFRCMYCGFTSQDNTIHHLNDNHGDNGPDNLRVADSLCHAWQHTGELGDGNAVLAYLPGLTGQDLNHLQRTLMIALHAGDAALQAEARTLLNWLGSHRQYTEMAWETSEPVAFAAAIARPDSPDRDTRALVFEDLAPVFNPDAHAHHVAVWAEQVVATAPVGTWHQVYHDVMNAPT